MYNAWNRSYSRVLSREETRSDLSFNKITLVPRLLVWTHQNQCTVSEFSVSPAHTAKELPSQISVYGGGRAVGELLAVQLSTLDLSNPLPTKLNLSHL